MIPLAAETELTFAVVVPSIIAVAGVLVVGILQALVNRAMHSEKLRKDASVERRVAFTKFMGIMQEGVGLDGQVENRTRDWRIVSQITTSIKLHGPEGDDGAGSVAEWEAKEAAIRQAMDDAIQRKYEWAIKRAAAQFEALATLDRPNNPLANIPALMQIATDMSSPLATQAGRDSLMALHVDGELRRRRRKKDQKMLNDIIEKRYALGSIPGKNPTSSPSGAGRHGTDNQQSDTEGGTNDGSRNNDES